MLLVLLFYGGLAMLAVATTWRTPVLRAVGLALLAGFVLSNLSHFWLAFSERPAVYTVIEVGISLAAFMGRIFGGPRGVIGVLSVSVLSITANIAISLYSVPTHSQIYVWECITNACYIAECLVAAGTGIYARGGFSRGIGYRGGHAAHARRRAE